jgi:hypothetical protein
MPARAARPAACPPLSRAPATDVPAARRGERSARGARSAPRRTGDDKQRGRCNRVHCESDSDTAMSGRAVWSRTSRYTAGRGDWLGTGWVATQTVRKTLYRCAGSIAHDTPRTTRSRAVLQSGCRRLAPPLGRSCAAAARGRTAQGRVFPSWCVVLPCPGRAADAARMSLHAHELPPPAHYLAGPACCRGGAVGRRGSEARFHG